MWFSNTFNGTAYNIDDEILVEFDDSYITDKEAELARLRDDAMSFEIPQLTIWYLMKAYNLTEDEAEKLVQQKMEVLEAEEKFEESED